METGPDHPKRCSSIGGPRETGFRPELSIFGFSEFPDFLVFCLRLGPHAKEIPGLPLDFHQVFPGLSPDCPLAFSQFSECFLRQTSSNSWPTTKKILENPQNPETQTTNNQVCSAKCWKFQPENPFPEVPQSSCIFWDGQGLFPRRSNLLIHVGREANNFSVGPGTNPTHDPKLVPSALPLKKPALGTWDHAHVKERQI